MKPARQIEQEWFSRPQAIKYLGLGARLNGRPCAIGEYPTAIEAAIAYNDFALKHYGQFARLNDIDIRKENHE